MKHSLTMPQAPVPHLDPRNDPAALAMNISRLMTYSQRLQEQLNNSYHLASQASDELLLSGPIAQRPPAGITDRLFWATDTFTAYYDDGTAWRVMDVPLPTSEPDGLTTPSYGPSVAIDRTLGKTFKILVTDGADFTIHNPMPAVDGRETTIIVRNDGAGVMGLITWDTAYRLAPFVNPTAGRMQSVTFVFDGTDWIETSRTPVEVPN